jgi:hypothetical protein
MTLLVATGLPINTQWFMHDFTMTRTYTVDIVTDCLCIVFVSLRFSVGFISVASVERFDRPAVRTLATTSSFYGYSWVRNCWGKYRCLWWRWASRSPNRVFRLWRTCDMCSQCYALFSSDLCDGSAAILNIQSYPLRTNLRVLLFLHVCRY